MDLNGELRHYLVRIIPADAPANMKITLPILKPCTLSEAKEKFNKAKLMPERQAGSTMELLVRNEDGTMTEVLTAD